MTRQVVSVRPGTPFKELVRLMLENEINSVPVVDEQGRPVGLVSEADLVHRVAVRPDPHGPTPGQPAEGDGRAAALTAGGLMSTPVVTARGDWSIPEAARTMERAGVKRLPVVDGSGRLVGVLGRRDLLLVFLRPDVAIREEVGREVLEHTALVPRGAVRAEVRDGVVTLVGRVPLRSTAALAERLCGEVDGVVAVLPRLEWAEDDTELAARAAG
ncbi:CBS domain-containing protein [Kitasatospora sp. NPDC058965]|uniref:CBS domain-containing protein n=1 Tax=Kitasatospora sp. NPDC058965 TaxID=3346682 RepID=UPI003684F601